MHHIDRSVTLSLLATTVLLMTPARADAQPWFVHSERCIACHQGLIAPDGQDASIGFQWRPSMMANAARDPYWQAAVRRETLDHPNAAAAIENECSTCHMPMAHVTDQAAERASRVFANLLPPAQQTAATRLASDGVSCSLCHQITPDGLGNPDSFVGNFKVDTTTPAGRRKVFGPFPTQPGLTRIMKSASTLVQEPAQHLRSSEMCATCHTLITEALGPDGEPVGRLPEQVPYLEWQSSGFRDVTSCADCHMPSTGGPTLIANILAEPRPNLSRHEFRGGNFLIPRMLARLGGELEIPALVQELDAAAQRSTEHLESRAARVSAVASRVDGRLEASVRIENLAGHKLPTAYPSRRVWLHLTVRDSAGTTLFESGALAAGGAIVGNDNDEDGARFEPHRAVITSPDQVAIYEAILGDSQGRVTTGLLSAVRYLKDNRLLPRGFDRANAPADVAVHGAAEVDADFAAPGHLVRYQIEVAEAKGPLEVEAVLMYQPIGHRWALNLDRYQAAEPARFVSLWKRLQGGTAHPLAQVSVTVRGDVAADRGPSPAPAVDPPAADPR